MPGFNPNDEHSIARLRDAMQFSRRLLRPFRENRLDMIRAYAGDNYGEGGEQTEILINMYELAINIYQRMLASQTPQVMCDSRTFALNAVAEELGITTNHVISKELNLGETLNSAVYDALFGMGIVKVGITPRERNEAAGYMHDSGRIFADVVDLSDWVHDMNAKRWDQIEYCGNRYVIPLSYVMESPLISKAAKRRIYAMRREDNDEPFARRHREDPAMLSQGNSMRSDATEITDSVQLWDIWLPREGLVITLAASDVNIPLQVVKWDGPEHGPYHILGFNKVPNNIMPLAPAMLWENLNDLINRLSIKAGQQADRQKTVLAAQNRAQAAMEAIVQSPDGMSVVTDTDPNLIKEFRFGGVDGNLMQALSAFKELYSYVCGNLDAIGGLAAQTRTIGQDKLLVQGATMRISDMQDRVVKFTEGIVRDIAWYIWDDPLAEYDLKMQINERLSVDFKWNRESRKGDFFDYEFRVEPFSMQNQSPSERLNFIMQIVSNVIIPMGPMLQEQGIVFDVEEFLRTIGRLSNNPDIPKLLRNVAGETLQPHGEQRPKQSPNTTRTYVREPTPSGQMQQPGQIPEFQQQPQQPAGVAQGA